MEKLVFGHCSAKFAAVERIFRRNFLNGWEREGASVAVYWRGQLVVDLHGGYADRSASAKWNEGTRTVLFSATKAVAALAMHMLVERNCIAYNDPICRHWPEFAQNGKERITLADVLNHRSGLAAFDEPITLEAARDPQRIAEIIERQQPNWVPGTQSGYHAVTFGWLLDQILRRVDPKRRSMAAFVREEICQQHGIDFHLGLPLEYSHTVSRLTMPDWRFKAREILHDPRVLVVLMILHARTRASLRTRIANNTEWIRLDSKGCTLNNPQLYSLEQAGALGIGRARDLARIFALALEGKFISQKTLERIRCPEIVNQTDCVLNVPMCKGNGFMYEKHPKKPGKWLFGHPAFGGSNVMIEPEEQLVIAYVSNGLKSGMGEVTGTYRRLRNAVFDSIAQMELE